MSYCRWSTDDFKCDLYCYADCRGGYTTHVAGNRIIYKKELPPEINLTKETIPAVLERRRKVMKMHEDADRVDIGLPHDGETFNDPDLGSFLQTLLKLKSAGYSFPNNVINVVREEINE